ncbi:hypothetical protein B0H21DRAFT_709235 [Amylocystis lapponica]|nr:hypothetical protein B0H21DRAFT_709235 [Amylocystis lapponica]
MPKTTQTHAMHHRTSPLIGVHPRATESHTHPRVREAVRKTEKLRLTTSLFDGGALDSQVSDSQYVRELIGADTVHPMRTERGRSEDAIFTLPPRPQPNRHPIERDTSPDMLKPAERTIMAAFREAVASENEALRAALHEEVVCNHDLRGHCRALEVWIQDLADALTEHEVAVPPFPGGQYAALASP